MLRDVSKHNIEEIPIRLFIATPAVNLCHSVFMCNMIDFISTLWSVPLPEPFRLDGFKYMNMRTSILSKKRETLVNAAIEGDYTHLLFLDSDQSFPKDIAHRMLLHRKDCVAANIAIKTIPSVPSARQYKDDGFGEVVWPRNPKESIKNPLEKVWMIGTGVMLFTVSSLKKVPVPRFMMGWNHKANDYIGEDWSFIERYHKAGFSTYIDHDISWDVSHLGDYDYNYALLWQQAQIEKANNAKAKERRKSK